jgi:hypothetical protein
VQERAARRATLNNNTQVGTIVRIREQAIAAMNESLRKQFTKIEGAFESLQTDNIRYYHRLGKIVKTIQDNAGEYVGGDGTPGMELVEKAMATQTRTLRTCATFARCYTDEDVRALIEMRNVQTNFRLHWGHVKYLLTLSTKEARDKYAHDAVARMWDPATLHERIKKQENRSGGHGRSHLVPATPEKQARQMRDISKQWHDKQTKVWNGTETNVFSNILEASPTQVTGDLVEYLNEARDLMVEIADAAKGNVRRCEQALSYCTKILEEKERAVVSQASPSNPSARRGIEVD